MRLRPLLSLLTAILLPGAALAANPGADSPGPSAPGADSGWTFSFSPYAWASGISGTSGKAPLPYADVKSSFNDIWDNLDIAVMGAFDARKGRYSIIGDLLYAKTSVTDHNGNGILRKNIDITSETFSSMVGGGYSVLQGPRGNLDLVAGARLWSVSTRLSIEGGYLDGRRGRGSATWVDAVGGLKGSYHLTDRTYLTGWAMVGGGEARLDWDLMAAVGYQATKQVSVALGYRALGVDYRQGGFVYDVVQRGPMLGMTYQF
ncbi:hypothetical protein [Bordetella genomosp. 12]|uniref:Outer membrane protein beta-barrel domain-containing protein n=1 Tax=Bordetella genomosp. 12 TaxID=463035 RepID=A0A261VM10_9BORD|nr:hypothetical protein [Bordetella genomosp. 12]OZI75099.1 hypothetical protein CAL22_11860 [Bordetella genomosp. 12]